MKGQDLEIIDGFRKGPAIVFIHGLGMDKRIWVSPEKARILNGRFPINLLLCKEKAGLIERSREWINQGPITPITPWGKLIVGTPYCELRTVFQDLKEEGYSLIAWSQSRPAAPIDVAVSELKDVLRLSHEYNPSDLILIGHSRGGLIGRRYLQLYIDRRVKALITIATPHRGTRMATIVKYISPFASFIKSLVPESRGSEIIYLLKRMSEFLSSKAVMELMPDSDFIRSLDDSGMNGVKYLSIGGSSSSLLCFDRIFEVNMDKIKRERILSFPDAIERFFPRRFLPKEIVDGEGDGLVSVESSKIPWKAEHYTFRYNHAEILFSREVRKRIVNTIKEITG